MPQGMRNTGLLKGEKNVLIENAIAVNIAGVGRYRAKAIFLIYVDHNGAACHYVRKSFRKKRLIWRQIVAHTVTIAPRKSELLKIISVTRICFIIFKFRLFENFLVS